MNSEPRLTRQFLLARLRSRDFAPAAMRPRPLIGAEAEFIPVDIRSGEVLSIHGTSGSSMEMLRRASARHRWRESRSSKGTPVFVLPDGATLGFEPGGQMELSSAPHASASGLLGELHAVAAIMSHSAAESGAELLSVGIDPQNPIDKVPLQLDVERYSRMSEYFSTLGPTGAMMMRQTAAFQINLDSGAEPERLWRVLNSMAPYATAIFANSPMYAGTFSGRVSVRAHCWRTLDPLRTGMRPATEDMAEDYLEFALAAPAMFLEPLDGRKYASFAYHLNHGVTLEDWDTHLTTLFPEVRPRGTYEVRSCDAIPPEWYAAPLALYGGIAYDLAALRQADELLEGDHASLIAAGDTGLRDPRLAAVARDLVILALDGCESLGPEFMEPRDLEVAREFFSRYTLAGRSLADDVEPAVFAR